MTDFKENAIEWINGQDIVLCTISQLKLKNKIIALSREYPDKVRIIKENEFGTILASVPLKCLRIVAPRESTMSEERKEELRSRLVLIRANKKTSHKSDEDKETEDE